jgi:DNA-binding NarL/FixJ family response regulator
LLPPKKKQSYTHSRIAEGKSKPMIKVLVADDDRDLRELICMLLKGMADISPINQAADGYEAVKLSQELTPDVVLLDLRMPGLDGLEAATRIVALGLKTRVIITSQYISPMMLNQLQEHGVVGYLSKRAILQKLETAVHTVYSGNTYFPTSSPDFSP